MSRINRGVQSRESVPVHWVVLVLFLVGFGALIAANLYYGRAQIIEREQNRLLTQARVIEENLANQLSGIDQMLLGIRAEMAALPPSDPYPAILNEQLILLDSAMPGIRSVFVMDSNGTMQLTNRDDLRGKNLKQRLYFQQALAAHDPNILFISSPFKTVTGLWGINVSRVMLDGHGKFAGIVGATLDRDYFKSLLNSVSYAPDMGSTIIHGDGIQFAMVPGDESAAGRDLTQPEAPFMRYMGSGKSEEVLIATNGIIHTERMIAFHTIKPAALPMNKPLIVAVGRDMSAITQPWRLGAIRQGTIFSVVALLSIVAVAGFQRYRSASRRKIHEANELVRQSEHDLRSVLDSVPAVINYWDRDLKNRFGNRAHLDWFGIDPDKLPGMSMSEVTTEARFRLNLPYIEAALRGEVQRFERVIPRPDGDGLRQALIQYVPDFVDNEVRGFYAIVSDVSPLKDAEIALRESVERYNDLVARLPIGISTFRIRADGSSGFDYMSSKYRDILGLEPEALRNNAGAYFAAAHPDDLDGLIRTNEEARQEAKPFRWDGRFLVRGETRWIRIESDPVMLPNGDSLWNGMVSDITTRKLAEAEVERANSLLQQRFLEVQRLQELLQEQVIRDGLTGLYNRRYFDETLLREIARARREQGDLALVMVDVDHFKKVNDTYGHQAGDVVLKYLADLLNHEIRGEDAACRYGGEEFSIIMPSASLSTAMRRAEGWRQKFEAARIDIGNGHLWQGTMSLGVACFPYQADEAAGLIASADAALYRAKQAGRNRVVASDKELLG